MPALVPKKITIEFEGMNRPLEIEKPAPGSGDPNLLRQIHGIFLNPAAAKFYETCGTNNPGQKPPTSPADELRAKLDEYCRQNGCQGGTGPSTQSNPSTPVDESCIKLSDCTWWCPED